MGSSILFGEIGDATLTGTLAKGAPKRRAIDTLKALGQPKVALMFALGFSSGLPFMLIGNTLTLWLAEAGVKLATIGFASWIALTYSLKFIWGAVVDRLPAPAIGALGRRRGWMILTQLTVAVGLIGMAVSDPRTHLARMIVFGLVAGVGAAAQDTVIDAWRIETAADPDELGLLTSSYSLGYRIAMIATEAVILQIAAAFGWPISYGAFGALMVVGIAAAFLAREPAAADTIMEAKSHEPPLRRLTDTVVGPLLEFLRAHGLALALLMLAAISLYHLCDYMRGPMSNPYYKALGIPKTTIAAVRETIGLAGAFVGIALGGASALRLGNARTLILGAFLQPVAVASFAVLGAHGGDWTLAQIGPLHLTAFEAVMGLDSVTMAFAGVALVAYMSTLTSLGYTATQYALLTSVLTLVGKGLKGFSGVIVERLEVGRSVLAAYELFYLLAGAIGVPAIVLCIVLLRVRGAYPVDVSRAALPAN